MYFANEIVVTACHGLRLVFGLLTLVDLFHFLNIISFSSDVSCITLSWLSDSLLIAR